MLQFRFYLYDTVHYSIVPMIVLLIWYENPCVSKYEFCWYDTVHYSPNTRPIDTIVHYCPNTTPTDTLQSTHVPVLVLLSGPVLLISYSTSVVYQSWRYNMHPSSVPVPVLLIWYSPLNCPSHRPFDTIVYYCPITSPTDTLQSTTAPVLILLMPYNPLLLHYQSYWYESVHYCPSTNQTFTLQ